LDVSGSMDGNPLNEMIRAVTAYINCSERLGFQERIAIVIFGQESSVRCSLTTDYAKLKLVVAGLKAGGSTPMDIGLALAFKELVESGRILNIGCITIFPRIILLTDGEPNDYPKTLSHAQSLGELSFPISAMGVSGCNEEKMRRIAEASGGCFMMVNEIDKLVDQFVTQIMLIVFVMEMQDRIEQLFNKYALKSYLEEKMQKTVSDEEVEMFILFLRSIVRVQEEIEDVPKKYNIKFGHSAQGPYINAQIKEGDSFAELQKTAQSVLGFTPNEFCLNGSCFNMFSGNKTIGQVLPLYEGAIIVTTKPSRDGLKM